METIQQQLFEKSNLRREYTEADLVQFQVAEKALNIDAWTAHGSSHNANLIDEFFQAHKELPVTVQNIYRAVEDRKGEFVWLSQAQVDWYRAAQQNIDLANSLPALLAAQGQPGRLVNDGDALFENLLLLFNELHSRRESASVQTLQNAEDRIAHRPGKQLHRVPQPRRTEPMSQAAKQDDGEPFLGRNVNMSPADYKRQAEAAYASSSPTPAKAKGPVDAWETIARSYLGNGGSHARNENLKNIFDRGFSGELSWREAARQMGELKKAYSALLPTARY
jgi:hypothetical protein